MSLRRLRPGWIVFTVSSLAFAAWFAYITLVPLVPYEPVCGLGRRMQYLEGPLRPEFADQLVVVLAREGFRFRRAGNVVLVPQEDIWPNRTESRVPWRAQYKYLLKFQINVDRRLASNIANGRLLTGWDPRIPDRIIIPPAPLQAYLHSLEPELGPFPPARNDVVAARSWSDRFTYDCSLLRIALIRTEDLPPGPPAP